MDRSVSSGLAARRRAVADLESFVDHTATLVRFLSAEQPWRAQRRRRRARVQRRARGIAVALAVAIAALLRVPLLLLWWVGSRFVRIALLRTHERRATAVATTVSAPHLPAPSPPRATGLAESTRQWLEREHGSLPMPARASLEVVVQRVKDLSAQLSHAPEHDIIRLELHRLVAEELPELVHSYQRLPRQLTGVASDGTQSPDQQLLSGIAIVERSLLRLQARLARPDLLALSTQVRYLTLKYAPDDDLRLR